MTESPSKKTVLAARIILAALVAACLSPIFSHPSALLGDDPAKTHDYLQQATYDYLFRYSILSERVFPLRTYFLGGGYPLSANPQDAAFSPFSLVTLAAGEALGMKINILLLTLIGALGFFALALRGFRTTVHGAFFGAAAYVLSGWWLSRLEWGFYFKLYFHFVPWIWLGIEKARRGEGSVVMPALLLAVTLTQLGLGYAVAGLFFLAYFALDAADSTPRGKWAAAGRAAWLVACAFGLSLVFAAAKVIPMAELIAQSPRGVDDYALYTGAYGGYPHFWHGAGVFLRSLAVYSDVPNEPVAPGIVTLVLALVGFAISGKRHWPLAAVAAVFTLICFGPYLPVDLFRPLWRLPLFHSMHAPYQLFSYFLLITICLFAARAFDLYREAHKGPYRPSVHLAFLVLLALLMGQAIYQDVPVLGKIFLHDAPKELRQSGFYQVKGEGMARGAPRSRLTQEYFNVRRNAGTIDWDGDVLLPENARPRYFIDHDDARRENPDYRGEAYLASGKGRVDFWRFTANRVVASGTAETEAVVVVNQNWDAHFRGIPNAMDYDGLLAAKVPPGPFRVTFVYRPFHTYAGITISILSIFAAFVWSMGQRGKDVSDQSVPTSS